MARPTFITRVLLHWMGTDEGWEVLESSLEHDASPMIDIDDDKDLIVEEAINKVTLSPEAVSLTPGDYLVILMAGNVEYTPYNTAEGIEYDTQVYGVWDHVRKLSPEEVSITDEVGGYGA